LVVTFLPSPGVEAQSLVDNEVAIGDFTPLTCNEDIANATCVSWVAQKYNYTEKVEILCGTCVTFDEPPGSNIVLDNGLSVTGRLVFPPNVSATIETPFIFVQGILEASSNKIVNSTNIDGLHFIMSGDDDQHLWPHIQNRDSCDSYFCKTGKKPIVVAGGKLDIRGLNETCPTWVNLLDVATDDMVVPEDYPTVPIAPQGCNRALVNETFDSGVGLFKSSLGCFDSIENENLNDVTKKNI